MKNFVIPFAVGFLLMELGKVLLGPVLGPAAFIIAFTSGALVALKRARERSMATDFAMKAVVDQMDIPEGRWLIRYNEFTPAGTVSTENEVTGSFWKVVPHIGSRTVEELERIRQMTADALDGGFNWVTLYNPIGIVKAYETRADSSYNIQYTPLQTLHV